MHGEDKESQRRGTERGGEGKMERGGDGEGELTGGHPSNLLSIFPPPVETQQEGERYCRYKTKPLRNQQNIFLVFVLTYSGRTVITKKRKSLFDSAPDISVLQGPCC